ncbi:PREDICTED: MKI67 FHA domain-interacting nucleolar phosphoprotein [Nanorana parkeri]|uniref:MKI67 FHA domain-interacting nucleolar phosphoprotein n=1 Tax=Nanorana parkeri TaxID=125878 RepID=UPI000854FCDF|nr:PREDICTED: MKI67 FHA domain-interacting nucleolar phosphoprotein [Nanorana parkeri]
MSEQTEPAGPLLSLDPKQQGEFQERVRKIRKRNRKVRGGEIGPGVLYIGHIPHLLHEPQLREYFGQFGTVTRLRLSRSKKTGNSKGYAFIEFECEEVAKIVATEKQQRKMTKRMLTKESNLRKRLAEKGIDYDFPGFAAHIKKTEDANITVNSDAPTPVCTPSILERRKSTHLEAPEDSDDEIIVKLPQVKSASKKKSKLSKSAQEEPPEDSDDEIVVNVPEVKTPPKKPKFRKSARVEARGDGEGEIVVRAPKMKTPAKKSKLGKSPHVAKPEDSDGEIVVKVPEVKTTSKKKSKLSKVDKRMKIRKLKLQTN